MKLSGFFLKNFFLSFFIFVLAVSLLFPLGANAFIPFGGTIVWLTFCDDSVWFITGPPIPNSYMYLWGRSISFLMGPPLHIGQMILGLYLPVYYVCFVGPVPIGGGFIVLFHGSSS